MGKIKIHKEQYPEIANLYKSGVPHKDIAYQFKVTVVTLTSILRKLGFDLSNDIKNNNRLYSINESFFDIIDTEQKAYFLGFLYADGYNHLLNYNVSLALNIKDIEILNKLNSVLESNRPISFKKNRDNDQMAVLNITNKHISSQLENLGVIQKKTFKLEFPDWLDESLHHHFIRGYFDGDGCISNNKNNELNFSLAGTEKFLIKIQNILVKQNQLNKTKLGYFKNKETKTLKYGGKIQVKRIFEWLYKDASIFLERKYKIFEKILIPVPTQRGITNTKHFRKRIFEQKEDGKIVLWESITDASRFYNCSQSSISNALRKIKKSCKGSKWYYENENTSDYSAMRS